MEKIHKSNSLLCKAEFSSATKTSFLLKTQQTTTLQQVTGGNAPNIVLNRMQRHFLKAPPRKKLYQLQERICFFKKQHKKQPLQQMSDGGKPNLVLKRMLELFPKLPPSRKY